MATKFIPARIVGNLSLYGMSTAGTSLSVVRPSAASHVEKVSKQGMLFISTHKERNIPCLKVQSQGAEEKG